jgi:hypothetical protein
LKKILVAAILLLVASSSFARTIYIDSSNYEEQNAIVLFKMDSIENVSCIYEENGEHFILLSYKNGSTDKMYGSEMHLEEIRESWFMSGDTM